MIHCTMEDLVALKGGEGTAWARRHLGECAVCRQEFDALHQRVAQLKALPTLNPPRDRWPVVRVQVLAARNRKRMVRLRWGSLALAASLVGVIMVSRNGPPYPRTTTDQDLQALVSRSQQLEERLQEYDPGSRVMSGATAGAVAALEDRIAAVDAELGEGPAREQDELMNLWRQRVQLMEGLVNVHVARATYSGM
jgi:hypothetical protein